MGNDKIDGEQRGIRLKKGLNHSDEVGNLKKGNPMEQDEIPEGKIMEEGGAAGIRTIRRV